MGAATKNTIRHKKEGVREFFTTASLEECRGV
jgi:hypothetical protein